MDKQAKLTLRPAAERGTAEHGWLHSRFSFSFADYYDPAHMGFRSLRVINDDIIEPDQGFGMHPHQDMEIVSYVVEGALEHKDSMGNGSVVRPGDVQRMSAGTGIRHSEFNPLKESAMRLIQIWITPEQAGLEPGYEQIRVEESQKLNKLTVIASRDGRNGSVTIHQDASIHATVIEPGQCVMHESDPARGIWVQVVQGLANIEGTQVSTGDGAAIEGARHVTITATERTELLLFDLA